MAAAFYLRYSINLHCRDLMAIEHTGNPKIFRIFAELL